MKKKSTRKPVKRKKGSRPQPSERTLAELTPGPTAVRRPTTPSNNDPGTTAAWTRAQRTLDAHRGALLARPGVIAVEVAPRLVGGQPTTTPAIRVYVYRKRSREELSRDEMLPERIDGVPIDAAPGSFEASGCASVSGPLFRRWPYLQGGVTIGRLGFRNLASLGALFLSQDDPELVLGLTAGHAFEEGDSVVQPARGASRDTIGSIVALEVSQSMDAAVFEVERNSRRLLSGVAGAGGPTQIGQLQADAKEYSPVFMAGGCSGWRTGWARRSSEPLPVDYPGGQTLLRDHIHLLSDSPDRPFNQAGDSGALLLSQNGDLGYGLVIAGGMYEGKWQGLATPLDRIVDRFRLRLAV